MPFGLQVALLAQLPSPFLGRPAPFKPEQRMDGLLSSQSEFNLVHNAAGHSVTSTVYSSPQGGAAYAWSSYRGSCLRSIVTIAWHNHRDVIILGRTSPQRDIPTKSDPLWSKSTACRVLLNSTLSSDRAL